MSSTVLDLLLLVAACLMSGTLCYVVGAALGYRCGRRVVTVRPHRDARVVDDNVWASYQTYRWLEKGPKEPLHEAIRRQVAAAELEGFWRGSAAEQDHTMEALNEKRSAETRALLLTRDIGEYSAAWTKAEEQRDRALTLCEEAQDKLHAALDENDRLREEVRTARADCETVAAFAREAGRKEGEKQSRGVPPSFWPSAKDSEAAPVSFSIASCSKGWTASTGFSVPPGAILAMNGAGTIVKAESPSTWTAAAFEEDEGPAMGLVGGGGAGGGASVLDAAPYVPQVGDVVAVDPDSGRKDSSGRHFGKGPSFMASHIAPHHWVVKALAGTDDSAMLQRHGSYDWRVGVEALRLVERPA